MANTQGSQENPFCIDDIEPPKPPHPGKGKAKAYYELHDDKPPTELPVDNIPAINRVRDKVKSNRDSINATGDRQFSYHRSANLTANKTSRTPAARHGAQDEIIIIDDDEPYFTSQTPSEQLRRETDLMSNEEKAMLPSGSRAHAVPPAPSLPLSGLFSPHFGRRQALPHAVPEVGEKGKPIPTTSRPVDPVVINTAQSPNIDVALAGSPQGSWRGATPISHGHNQYGNTDKTFQQGVNITPDDMANQRSFALPIGDRVDPEREQTTSRRVSTNATSIPARVNITNEVGKTSGSPDVPERARNGGNANAFQSPTFKMPSKPRASKTASNDPWRPSGDERSVHQSERKHAYSQSSVPVPEGNSYSASVPMRRDVDERPERAPSSSSNSSHQKENPEHHQAVEARLMNGILVGSVSALSAVVPTTTGAHTSASTAPPLPLLSSGTTPDNASTILAPSSGPNSVSSKSLLSELHDSATKDIAIARRGIEALLKHHLEVRYEDHAYLVKVQFNVCICRIPSLHEEELNVASEDVS
jgi:hypothetical protein